MSLSLVDKFVSEKFYDFQLVIFYLFNIEQVRRIGYESRVAHSGSESRMVQHVEHKCDVGLDTLYYHLRKSSYSLSSGIFESPAEGRHLYQQTIVERCYLRALESVSTVQTNTESARAPVVFYYSCVGHKTVCRVLSSDSALYRMACHLDGVLIRNSDLR